MIEDFSWKEVIWVRICLWEWEWLLPSTNYANYTKRMKYHYAIPSTINGDSLFIWILMIYLDALCCYYSGFHYSDMGFKPHLSAWSVKSLEFLFCGEVVSDSADSVYNTILLFLTPELLWIYRFPHANNLFYATMTQFSYWLWSVHHHMYALNTNLSKASIG